MFLVLLRIPARYT